MGIRFPLKNIRVITDTGTSSVATGTIATFNIPQDTDNVVLKLVTSITGGGASAFLQTTPDGGTTWFDVGRTSVVSSDGTERLAQFLSAPVISQGLRTGVNQANSILTVAVGSPTASLTGVQQMTGLPILGTLNRVVLSYSAAGTSNGVAYVDVLVNSEAQNG